MDNLVGSLVSLKFDKAMCIVIGMIPRKLTKDDPWSKLVLYCNNADDFYDQNNLA